MGTPGELRVARYADLETASIPTGLDFGSNVTHRR
jgi:hypothetical protein